MQQLTFYIYHTILNFHAYFTTHQSPYDKLLLQDLSELLAVFMAMIAHHKTIESTSVIEPFDGYHECIVCGRFIWNTEIICRQGTEECSVCSYCPIPDEVTERVACVRRDIDIERAEWLCSELIQITGVMPTNIPYLQEPLPPRCYHLLHTCAQENCEQQFCTKCDYMASGDCDWVPVFCNKHGDSAHQLRKCQDYQQLLQDLCKKDFLTVKSVQPDGNCFFRCMATINTSAGNVAIGLM